MLNKNEYCLQYIDSVMKNCARGKFGDEVAIHKIKRVVDACIHLDTTIHKCCECNDIIQKIENDLKQAQHDLIDADKANSEALKIFDEILSD